MATAKLKISGRVQGVFYRQSTRDQARALGLSGWVRNVHDGSVEAEVSGPKPAVEELIKWCHSGPPTADVSEVIVDWHEGEDDLHHGKFDIR